MTDTKRSRSQSLAIVGLGLIGLSTLIINPFAASRSAVFIEPKTTVFTLAVGFFLLSYLAVQRRSDSRPRLSWRSLSANQRIDRALMLIWIGSILLATAMARDPLVSLYGYSVSAEGAAFYLLLTLLVVLVRFHSRHVPGFRTLILWVAVIVGVAASILAIPQKFDWRIDYVFDPLGAAGAVASEHLTQTSAGVQQAQTPNSVFWNRGHFGFVAAIAVAASAILLVLEWRRERALVLAAMLAIVVSGALISDVRAAQVGALLAVASALVLPIPKLGQRVRSGGTLGVRILLVGAVLVGAALGGLVTTASGASRPSSMASVVTGSSGITDLGIGGSSGRLRFWTIALDAWLERPMVGRGFLAFHQAQGEASAQAALASGRLDPAYTRDTTIIEVSEFRVRVKSLDGDVVWTAPIRATKPHNALLELLLSVGAIGVFALLGTFGRVLYGIVRSGAFFSVTLMALVGGVYLMTWYESVQYSPLFWATFAAVSVPTAEA